jgi:hypothetical protein
MKTSILKILQYNVNYGKEVTIIPLLQDTRIHEFDILAIQELWGNKSTPTSYNPYDSLFYLAYPPKQETRIYIYVNKRIHPDC